MKRSTLWNTEPAYGRQCAAAAHHLRHSFAHETGVTYEAATYVGFRVAVEGIRVSWDQMPVGRLTGVWYLPTGVRVSDVLRILHRDSFTR